MKIEMKKLMLGFIGLVMVASLRADVVCNMVNLKKKINERTFGLTDLIPLKGLLNLIPRETFGNDIIGAEVSKFNKPPKEINEKDGFSIEGSIKFGGKNVNCRIIVACVTDDRVVDLPFDEEETNKDVKKEETDKDAEKKEVDKDAKKTEADKDVKKEEADKNKKKAANIPLRTVCSISLFLPAGFKVADLKVLKSIPGVSKDTFDKFGNIDLPEGMLTFSTFSYTEPTFNIKISPGISITSKTKVTQLLSGVRAEINRLTSNNSKNIPFIAGIKDDQPVVFNLYLGFEGSLFKSIAAELALPISMGIDFEKLRRIESQFVPNMVPKWSIGFAGIKVDTQNVLKDLNSSVKSVTSMLNKKPLNFIKTASLENVTAVIKYDLSTMLISFATELNVTANNGERYGMRGAVYLSFDDLMIEIQKSPSIEKINLGNNVYMRDIGLSVVTDFKLLATTGVPVSGFGLLGKIDFPFASETVVVDLGGRINVAKGGLFLRGQLQNLNASKLAQFSASLIENFGKKVGFDSSSMTQAMKSMPKIMVNDGNIYFSSSDTKINGKEYPMGLGVDLDITVDDKYNGKMAVRGNAKNLAARGAVSAIEIKDIITITGPGFDGKYDTEDDGVAASFMLSSEKPQDSNFQLAGRVILPAIKLTGEGQLTLGAEIIKGVFSAQMQDLFLAKFNTEFNPKEIKTMKLGFSVEGEQREKFMELIYKGIEDGAKIEKDSLGKALKNLENELNKAKRDLDRTDYAATIEANKAVDQFNSDVQECKNWVNDDMTGQVAKTASPANWIEKKDYVNPPRACSNVGANTGDLIKKGTKVLATRSAKAFSAAAQQALNQVNTLNDKYDVTKKAQESVMLALDKIKDGLKSVKAVLPRKVAAVVKVGDWKAIIDILGARITLPDPIGEVSLDVEDFEISLKSPLNSALRSLGISLFNKQIMPLLNKIPELVGNIEL